MADEDLESLLESLLFLFLPFFKLACPESSLSNGLHVEQLQELDDDEPLELSDVIPMDIFISIFLVKSTKSVL